MKKYCFALDLKEDIALIQAYEDYHKAVWPEITKSILDADIHSLEIYRFDNRLCMIMETGPDFSFEKKMQLDASNPKVQAWEILMWQFQKALPNSHAGEKWVRMQKIYDLNESV